MQFLAAAFPSLLPAPSRSLRVCLHLDRADGKRDFDTFGTVTPLQTLNELMLATTGVLVSSVQPGSPAAKAGLRPTDIIEKANGTDIVSPAELLTIIGQSEPGIRIPLTIRRNSRQQKVEVIVSEFPGRQARLELDDESLVVRLERPPEQNPPAASKPFKDWTI